MILYYQENNGDYLALDETLKTTFFVQGRAAAIAGNVGSVCTTSISPHYLAWNCRLVQKEDVPAEWLKAIGLHCGACSSLAGIAKDRDGWPLCDECAAVILPYEQKKGLSMKVFSFSATIYRDKEIICGFRIEVLADNLKEAIGKAAKDAVADMPEANGVSVYLIDADHRSVS